nr:efflux RND transporter periplasmic adaptor subunit [Catenovulum maritimum]
MLTACSEAPQTNSQAQARPLTSIDVAHVVSKPVQSWFTYTTRLQAPEQVALTPRVSGVLESIEFIEGQKVNKGDLLFRLDPRIFEAEVAKLTAQVASANASLEQAVSEAERAVRLSNRNAISKEEVESRTTAVKQAQAEVSALKAQLASAQLDLDFTQIKSPINGIISRAEITQGNSVTAQQSILTSIVSSQKMYAYFDIDERTWNQYFASTSASDQLPVVMQLLGNKDFEHIGKVDFIDNQINTSTGTLRVRATFSANSNQLRAGSFARVKISSSEEQNKIIIPEKAIGTDLKNKFVLVLNKDNILEYRVVKLGDQYGEFRAIDSGLSAEDIIAVNGPAKVGPGMPVSPRQTQLDLSNIAFTLDKSPQDSLLTSIN